MICHPPYKYSLYQFSSPILIEVFFGSNFLQGRSWRNKIKTRDTGWKYVSSWKGRMKNWGLRVIYGTRCETRGANWLKVCDSWLFPQTNYLAKRLIDTTDTLVRTLLLHLWHSPIQHSKAGRLTHEFFVYQYWVDTWKSKQTDRSMLIAHAKRSL